MDRTDHLLIGIDLGTTNAKIACFDLNGNLQASASRPIKTYFPKPGWYEQHPEDWLLALEDAMCEVVSKIESKSKNIKGISVSNFGPGMVLIRDNKAIAPCPTWQDERCWEHGQKLIDEMGADWIGFGVPQTGFPAKIYWAIENTPELISKADYIFDIKAYLINWLTGIAATDPSSGPGSNDWNFPIFEYINWPMDRLPVIKEVTDMVGFVKEELAENVGLPHNTPVFTGLNDGASATLGSGVHQVGQGIITLATNGVVRLVIPRRLDSKILLNKAMFTWPFIDQLWICGGFTLSGAGSLQWFADILGVPNEVKAYSELLEKASNVPIGSKGVVFIPYLSGRGSPLLDPKLRGGFLNVALEHGREELVHALLEGLTFALAEIVEEIKTLDFEVKSFHLTGGGARSDLWQHMISDVLKSSIVYAGGDSTLGCAIIAAVGLGIYKNFHEATENMVHPISQINFDNYRSNTYQQLFKYFKQTRNAVLNAPYPRWNWENSKTKT